MSLLETDDADSAIESDDEPPFAVRKRRFSRQLTCVGDDIRKSLMRQESLYTEDNRMQSELSLATETQQVEVFVSIGCLKKLVPHFRG